MTRDMRTKISICITLIFSLSGAFILLSEDAARPQSPSQAAEPVLDLGSFPAKDKKEAVFRIANPGDKTLKIIGIRHTCGACVGAAVSKNEIEPGGSADLKIGIPAFSMSGKFRKNIYVETDLPSGRFLNFTITGNSVPVVAVTPEGLVNVGRIASGCEFSSELGLAPNFKGVELGDPSVKCTCPASARLAKKGDGYVLHLTIAPPASFSGEFRCTASLPVKSPEGWKPVEIQIAGNVGFMLVAVPSAIHLPPASDKEVRKTFDIRLLAGPGSSLDAGSIRVESPDGAEFSFIQTDRASVRAEVSFSLKCLEKLRNTGPSEIRFSTETGLCAKIRIGVDRGMLTPSGRPAETPAQ